MGGTSREESGEAANCLLLHPAFPAMGLLTWALLAVGAISHVTALQRLRYARRLLLDAAAQQGEKGRGVV